MEITIQNEDDYFNTAMEVAKLAKGQQADFERIFEEKNNRRREKLSQLMEGCAYQTLYDKEVFPCERSRQTVSKVCSSGCLQAFLELLTGISYGWEGNSTEAQLGSNFASNIKDTEAMQSNASSYDQLATQLPPAECITMEEQPAYTTYPMGIFILENCENDNETPHISRKRSVFCSTL